MLHLLEPTNPRWVDAAAEDLTGLLMDHAHCELKAAQSALAIVGRFGADAPVLIEPLSDLAREETAHFRQVYALIGEHQGELGKPEKDEYVADLMKAARSDEKKEPILLDRLLVSALIEARSCERFKLLSEGLPSEQLRTFYQGLMAAEARHFRLFSGLAESIFGIDARHRLAELARREARVAHALPLGPQVHG